MRHNVLNCPDPLKALSTRAWYPAGTEQPYRAVREPHSSVTAGGGGGGQGRVLSWVQSEGPPLFSWYNRQEKTR